MNFVNKHVYLILDVDKFFYLQADALIKKCEIDPRKLCAVVIQASKKDNFESLKKVKKVEYLRYSDVLIQEIILAKTITSMSLSSYNSWLVNKLIKSNQEVLNKMYLFITDDEVERWRQVYSENGKIVSDPDRFITNDDVEVLNSIKNMIGIEKVFGPVIKKLLRRDVKFVNSGAIFGTLSYKKSLEFSKLLDKNNSCIKRIMWGTKGITRSSLKDIVLFAHKVPYKHFEIVIFTQSIINIVLLEMVKFWLKLFLKKIINISYLSKTDSITYTSILYSCTDIFLQDRGGASTAKVFIESGRGVIYARSGSHNYEYFKNGLGLDLVAYKSICELSNNIVRKSINIESNGLKLKLLEKQWIKEYQDLYR